MSDPDFSTYPSAGLFRQLAAMVYDSLLIFALLCFAGAIALIINQGEAVAQLIWFRLSLLFIIVTYYAWFWQKSGQTLGMSAWKIRIVTTAGDTPGWGVCYQRIAWAAVSIACLGMGYLWRLFTPYTWHDRLSHTRIIKLTAAK